MVPIGVGHFGSATSLAQPRPRLLDSLHMIWVQCPHFLVVPFVGNPISLAPVVVPLALESNATKFVLKFLCPIGQESNFPEIRVGDVPPLS